MTKPATYIDYEATRKSGATIGVIPTYGTDHTGRRKPLWKIEVEKLARKLEADQKR